MRTTRSVLATEAQALRDRDEELVAGAVAERIVDVLEMIEVDVMRARAGNPPHLPWP
jgi:hypothetical protein